MKHLTNILAFLILACFTISAYAKEINSTFNESGSNVANTLANSSGFKATDENIPGINKPIQNTWGFQIIGNSRLQNGGITQVLPALGVRKWFNEKTGFECGASVGVMHRRNGSSDTDIGVGGHGGYLMALSHYKHLTLFFEPSMGLYFDWPDSGKKWLLLNFRGSIGAEIRLGMLDLPRLAVTTRIGGGLDVSMQEDRDTILLLGTSTGYNNGIRGLIESTLGFVFYM